MWGRLQISHLIEGKMAANLQMIFSNGFWMRIFVIWIQILMECVPMCAVESPLVYLLIPVITLHLSIVAQKHSIATITKLRSLELLIKTPLLHILYYISGLTHDFWTRTGGWEFDHSHGAGTSSPSHWQQVEEQAPKPVGWMMCFLLMTLVPVQKLCVNIYLYICVHIPYTSSVIGCIYNGSVIQYWRSCTPSCSTGECAVPGLNTMLFSLVYQLCLALW